jgi:hypothetical protein
MDCLRIVKGRNKSTPTTTAEMTLRWHNKKSLLGYATAPGVSRPCLTGESRVQSQASPCGSCGERRGRRTGFSEYSCLSLSLSFHQWLLLTKSSITDNMSQKLTASLSNKLIQGKLSKNQITDVNHDGKFDITVVITIRRFLRSCEASRRAKFRNKIN